MGFVPLQEEEEGGNHGIHDDKAAVYNPGSGASPGTFI